MTHPADFRALSELLTGEHPLDPALADAHRERLALAFPTDINTYRDAAAQADPASLRAALNAATALARAARETIAIWYTAQFTRPDNTQDAPDTPQHYRSGLVLETRDQW